MSIALAGVAVACGSDATDRGSGSESNTDGGTTSSSGDASDTGAEDASSADAPGTSGASACEAAGAALCARACACADDGKCRLAIPVDSGLPSSGNFDSEAECRDVYVTLACVGGGEPGFDYAACETQAKAAACVDSAGGRGVLRPPECHVDD